MRKLPSYFCLQLKRAARLLPRMLAVTLLLAVLTAMAALVLHRVNQDDPSQSMLRIGVAGDSGEEILDEALDILEQVDSSRFSLRFERMGEAEGQQLLRRGELNGLVLSRRALPKLSGTETICPSPMPPMPPALTWALF